MYYIYCPHRSDIIYIHQSAASCIFLFFWGYMYGCIPLPAVQIALKNGWKPFWFLQLPSFSPSALFPLFRLYIILCTHCKNKLPTKQNNVVLHFGKNKKTTFARVSSFYWRWVLKYMWAISHHWQCGCTHNTFQLYCRVLQYTIAPSNLMGLQTKSIKMELHHQKPIWNHLFSCYNKSRWWWKGFCVVY